MLASLKAAVQARWRFALAWACEGKPLWIWIAVALGLTLLPALWTGDLSDQLRWSGMFLQFVGLFVVARGLNDARHLFARPSLLRAAWAWASRARHIVRPPGRVLLTASSTLGVSFSSGTLRVGRAVGNSVEDRLAHLQKELDRIEADTTRKLDELEGKMNVRVDREATERKAADAKVTEQLETAMIGGIQLEVAGLGYLFVGVAFTSIPGEIATAWRWLVHSPI